MVEILSIAAGVTLLLLVLSMLIPTRGSGAGHVKASASEKALHLKSTELAYETLISTWAIHNQNMVRVCGELKSITWDALIQLATKTRQFAPKGWLDSRTQILNRQSISYLHAKYRTLDCSWVLAAFQWQDDSLKNESSDRLAIDQAYRSATQQLAEQIDGYGLLSSLSPYSVLCAIPVANSVCMNDLKLFARRMVSQTLNDLQSKSIKLNGTECPIRCSCKYALVGSNEPVPAIIDKLAESSPESETASGVQVWSDANWVSEDTNGDLAATVIERQKRSYQIPSKSDTASFLLNESIVTADAHEVSEELAGRKPAVAAMGVQKPAVKTESTAKVQDDAPETMTSEPISNELPPTEAAEQDDASEAIEEAVEASEQEDDNISSPDEIEALFARARKPVAESPERPAMKPEPDATPAQVSVEVDEVKSDNASVVEKELDEAEKSTNESIEDLFASVKAAKKAAENTPVEPTEDASPKSSEEPENSAVTPDDIAKLFEAARGQ